MLISNVTNRDEALIVVLKELNHIGIKISNEKQKKPTNNRRNQKIFGVSLHSLELSNVPLSNGSQAQIPKFLATTCAALESEKNLETEGLFRRNGSLQKQKLMQELLEKGGSLDRSHHAIDIANLLKNFFRSLPEPLIPSGTIQEGLLRCLFHFSSYQEKCEAVLMLILLLPPISVNTLAYFLQFLEKLVKKSSSNLMSVENIVKVLTPTLMPVPHNAPQKRLFSHFKVLELLIENANLIGVVPERLSIFKKNVLIAPNTEERKKKNRRSGSMNRVFTGIHNGFNGLRKIVGAIGSSSESLDRSEEISQDPSAMTPKLIKSSKKRPLDRLDLSTKKKKDHLCSLASLPEQDDLSSPAKMRMDDKNSDGLSLVKEKTTPSKRRWSFGKSSGHKAASTSVEHLDLEEDFVKIPKSEFEAFKYRLNSIETKISHEFHKAKLNALKAEKEQNDSMLNGPEKVENKFNRTIQEVQLQGLEDSEGKTEQLAKRLSRDLKIRKNDDHAISRSPSARKIGSLRKRRESRVRLSRNQSWHLGQSSPGPLVKPKDDVSAFLPSTSFYPKSNLKRAKPVQTVTNQISHPFSSITSSSEKPERKIPEKPLRVKRESTDQPATPLKWNSNAPEVWTEATDFFKTQTPMIVEPEEMLFKTPVRPKRLSLSRSAVKSEKELSKTPMLPPRLTPAKVLHKTVSSTPIRSVDFSSANKSLLLSTPTMHDDSRGRESIIILRSKNAGMVAQKAKLFDGMSDKVVEPTVPRVIVNKNLENVRAMSFDDTPRKNIRNIPAETRSPRRSSRSPAGVQKRNQFKSNTQSPLKTIRECIGRDKLKLLKSNEHHEITSPKPKDVCRKPLTQSNTPRRKTPNSSKKQQATSKSPKCVRQYK